MTVPAQGALCLRLLTVADEWALARIAMRLTHSFIRHVKIAEPDAPYNGAAMAIGIAPMPKENVRRLLSELPLLR